MLGEDVCHRIAPVETATGDLVECCGAMCRKLAEDQPRFLARVACDLQSFADHPACDGDSGAAADPFEALLDDAVDRDSGCGGALHGEREHVLGMLHQGVAESCERELTLELGGVGCGRGRRHRAKERHRRVGRCF